MNQEPWRAVVELILERSVEPLERAVAISSKHRPEDRLCWHFMSLANLHSDEEANNAYYEAAKRTFGDRDDCALQLIAFGSFEVWDSVLPTLEGLRGRAEQLARASHAFGAKLEGWSYEPVGYPEGIPQAFGTTDEEEPNAQTH